jgi:hypothetical protein
MSAPHWERVLSRGCFSMEVLTPLRAVAEFDPDASLPKGKETVASRIECEGKSFRYVVRYLADGASEPTLMLMQDAPSVRSFIEDMQPRSVQILVAEGESEDAVIAAIHGQIH